MNTPEELNPAQVAQATTPLNRELRNLYRSARHIQHNAPYAAARLARIADQAEYFLQQWPDEQWPTVSQPDWPMPAKLVLIAWLEAVKLDTEPYVAGNTVWPYASWRQATTTLLAALVPFT